MRCSTAFDTMHYPLFSVAVQNGSQQPCMTASTPVGLHCVRQGGDSTSIHCALLLTQRMLHSSVLYKTGSRQAFVTARTCTARLICPVAYRAPAKIESDICMHHVQQPETQVWVLRKVHLHCSMHSNSHNRHPICVCITCSRIFVQKHRYDCTAMFACTASFTCTAECTAMVTVPGIKV